MVVFGHFMLGLAIKMCSVVGGTSSSPDQGCCCCGCTRDSVHKKLLSLSPMLDGGWPLQGVLLSYRIGAYSPTMAVGVAVLAGVGEALARSAAFAPEAVEQFVAPIGA